jgi:hypothetical protein
MFFLRRIIPAAVLGLLIAAAPASAATTTAAGPSPTPLILEVALAVLVGIAMAVREPVGKAFVAARRRIAGLLPRQTVRAPR